jgi:hypothetical protein
VKKFEPTQRRKMANENIERLEHAAREHLGNCLDCAFDLDLFCDVYTIVPRPIISIPAPPAYDTYAWPLDPTHYAFPIFPTHDVYMMARFINRLAREQFNVEK